MKRRSYLSSRESRSSLHHDSRNVRAIPRLKNIFSSDDLTPSFFRKIGNSRGGSGRDGRRRASRSLVVARSRISARHPRDFSKD